MNSSTLAHDASIESLVGRIADEFLKRQHDGERPDIEAYAARHPEAAELLRNVLASLQLLNDSQWAEGDANQSQFVESPVQLGDFRIEREVGRGGMGVVYEAVQTSLGRRVALKLLPLAGVLDSRRLIRFKNESRAAAGLHHSAIVPIYSIGCERGVHYYAMQFIDGTTLAAAIGHMRDLGDPTISVENGSAAPPARPMAAESTARSFATSAADREHCRDMARLAIVAAEALDYAHQHGVIHRDIKPANLMLDQDGRLWITDFGLARIETDVGVTLSGDIMGTLRYASPEQLLARQGVVDGRSDVYSLGATLYELLTLQPAFDGENRAELLRRIASEEPHSPRKLNPRIPGELETIVLKALEKNPADRYPTAADFAEDLKRHLENLPIVAKRAGPIQRAAKWLRRHEAAAAAVAAAIFALFLAGAVGSVFWAFAAARTAENRISINGRIAEALAAAAQARETSFLPGADALARERAREFAREAVTLSQSELADRNLAKQAQELLSLLDAESKDRQLLLRLDEAWMLATVPDPIDGSFQYHRSASNAMRAFKAWGLDPDKVSPLAAAAIIKDRPESVRAEITAGLDRWSQAVAWRKEAEPGDEQLLLWLAQTIEVIDADPWRRRLRSALYDRNFADLLELSKDGDVDNQPVFIQQVLGEALCSQAESEEAGLEILQRAGRKTPENFWIHYRLFVVHTDASPRRADEALRHATVAVALCPRVAVAHHIQAVAFAHAGRLPESIAASQQAIALDPSYSDAHFTLGNTLTDLNDMPGAEAAFRAAIRLSPEFAEAHLQLANNLAKQGQIPEATEEYLLAIEIRPNDTDALNRLGYLYLENGEFLTAVDFFRRAIAADKRSYPSHLGLGAAYVASRQFAKAEASFRAAMRHSPDLPYAYHNLGLMFRMLGRFAEAQEAFEQAIAFDEKLAMSHYELGMLHFLLGSFDRAEAEFQRAVQLAAVDRQANRGLADALKMQGRFGEALTAYQRAQELSAQSTSLRSAAAGWVKECQRLLELQRQLPELLPQDVQPQSAEECLELAEACRLLKRPAEAVDLYERAFAMAPSQRNEPHAQTLYRAACAACAASLVFEAADRKNSAAEASQPRALRKKALNWLREALTYWNVEARDASAGGLRPIVTLETWRSDAQLAAIRDRDTLEQLGGPEGADCRAFWRDVEALIVELREKQDRRESEGTVAH